jgi:3-methylfumaryl-CoA hydratase
MTPADVEAMRAAVGRKRRVTDSLNTFPARAFAAALDHDSLPDAGDALPPTWHWMYFLDTPATRESNIDGHPRKGGFLPPIPLPRRMWAAGALDILKPLRLGIQAEKQSTVRSIDIKEGKTGTLVFVNLEHELRQCNQLCIREDQSLVYRAMPTGSTTPPGGRCELVPERSRALTPDPVLLFRYSALTYNAHRIHYDRDYATRVEHYPGLVVHAPLLASLLLDLLLREFPGATPRQFRFRAVRPTFDRGTVRLHGRRDGSEAKLWTTDEDDVLGMSATALLASEGSAR